MHVPIFRVLYSTTFTLLLLLLLGLLLISPADAIFQSYINNELDNVIVVAAVYLLTLLVAGFVYATRIYATRTHLAALPRSHRVPDAAAGTAVRRLVAAGLARAAAIAYAAHPRDVSSEVDEHGAPLVPPAELPPVKPAFGVVQHRGWTAPSSADLPGVQFAPVIQELPHLLEAKAVSLAPPDPWATPPTGEGTTALPDSFAVAALQRPAAMDMRAYLDHLGGLGAVGDADAAEVFLAGYEGARFGGSSLDEEGFRDLMASFAGLLRCLRGPDPAVLRDLAESDKSSVGSQVPREARSAPASLRSVSSGALASRVVSPAPGPTSGPASGSASAVLRRLATGSVKPGVISAGSSSSLPSSSEARPGVLYPTSQPAFALAPSPLAFTPTSHQTPFFTPGRASLSSNDGDLSEDSAAIEAAASHRRLPRPRPVARSSHSSVPRSMRRSRIGSGIGLGLRTTGPPSRRSSEDESPSFHSADADDLDDDDASVIRRVVTARETPLAMMGLDFDDARREEDPPGLPIEAPILYPRNAASRHSGSTPRDSASDAGSVVVRPEDRGMGGLVPVAAANPDHEGGMEMRMVDVEATNE